MTTGLLMAGCGVAGQAGAGTAAPAGMDEAQGSLAAPARTLPVATPGKVLLVGEGWLSGPRNDYNLSLDAAARRMVFARSSADFKDSQIWWAQRVDGGWSMPEPVSFADPRYKDSDPWLTADGRTLYFVSNRPVSGDVPNGSLDVWRVAVHAEGFGRLEHLAAASSEGDELGPEVHGGWLYFNSSREGGPAKQSIYRAAVQHDGFGVPQALPAPFNDGRLQGDFTLSPDGRVAMFWRQPRDSRALDLYASCRTQNGWSRAVRLPEPINGPKMSFTPAFSADGAALYFASLRGDEGITGGQDAILNGQSNIYLAPAGLVREALGADCAD